MSPGPGEPLYWPEHPVTAAWHPGGDLTGWSRGWVVAGVPPAPWPDVGTKPDRALYGPAGTLWLYNVDDAADQLTHHGSTIGEKIAQQILKRLKIPDFNINTPWYWRVPGPNPEELMPVRAVRATVHGKLGTNEEVCHTFHLVPPTSSITDVAGIGSALASAWATFFNKTTPSPNLSATVNTYFSNQLVYDEVRVALVSYAPPAKPTYEIDTEYFPIVGCAGQGSNALPNEVAMAITYRTAKRGPRHRGRTYLGPFATSVLGSNGMFTTVADGIAKQFHDLFLAAPAVNETANFVVLSQKFGTYEWITGVDVGHVPDSMRSRRRSIPEAYAQIWRQ